MNLRIGEGFVWIDGHKICEGSQELFGNRGMELPVFEFKQPDGNIATIGDVNRIVTDKFEDLERIADVAINMRIAKLLESLAKRFETKSERWPKTEYGAILLESANVLRVEKENWK